MLIKTQKNIMMFKKTRTGSFYTYVQIKPIPFFENWYAREDGKIETPRGTLSGSPNKDGYLGVQDSTGTFHYIHRLVASAWVSNPRPDIFKEVDHINGLRDDNRPKNIRWVNRELNNLNKHGVKGYSYSSRFKKYKAQCTVKGTKHTIGWFKTCGQAREAYLAYRKNKWQEIYDTYINGETSAS